MQLAYKLGKNVEKKGCLAFVSMFYWKCLFPSLNPFVWCRRGDCFVVSAAKRRLILRSFVSTVLSDMLNVLPITFLVIFTLFALHA